METQPEEGPQASKAGEKANLIRKTPFWGSENCDAAGSGGRDVHVCPGQENG
jgi:hypothetical protein